MATIVELANLAVLGVIFHAWFLYPIGLASWRIIVGPRNLKKDHAYEPKVTVIVPVYNGEAMIERKLRQLSELRYPEEKLEFIVVSDGSTDNSAAVAETCKSFLPNLRVLDIKNNQGKSGAQNDAVKEAKHEIIIFTDIEARLDYQFIREIVPFFVDETVGCVGGDAILVGDPNNPTVSKSHGLYWRVERRLRKAESDLGVLHSLAGWGFALRRADYRELDQDTGDDMVLPCDMLKLGKRNVLAENAIVYDTMPSSPQRELKARRRITLRNLTALMRRRELLDLRVRPSIAIAIYSHKILRWFSPYLGGLSFALATILAVLGRPGYLVAEAALGVLLAISLRATLQGKKIQYISSLGSFALANAGFAAGVWAYFRRTRITSYSN